MPDKRNNRGIFKGFRRLKESGQIFPFLVVIIILMLVALMAFVNLGELNLRKVSTMNAADAGALAGASQLAGVANSIASVNVNELLASYKHWTSWVSRFWTLLPYVVWAPYTRFAGIAIRNLKVYLDLVLAGYAGVQQAGGSAVQLAFSNMPITEAAKRQGGYGGEIQKSGFSQYLEDLDIYTKEPHLEAEYDWNQYSYNLTKGVQEKSPEPEGVRIKVTKPNQNAFTLYPMPVAPDFTIFWVFLPPCVVVDGCSACLTMLDLGLQAYGEMYAAALTTGLIVAAAYQTGFALAMADEGLGPEVAAILEGVGAIATALTITLQPIPISDPSCPGVMAELVIWTVPLAFITDLGGVDQYKVAIDVTRFSPAKDLGLFQFKQQSITSGARAGVTSGSVFSPGSYNARVEEVWDGERI